MSVESQGQATGQITARSWQAAATALVAIVLLAWKHEALLLPPYQDQANGYWLEADFLAATNFDFYALRYGANHHMDMPPGPRSYMISVVPAAVAVLIKTVPYATARIVLVRVFTFLCGAWLIVAVYLLLRRWLPPMSAGLLCLGLATLPAFVVQLQISGMDVPLACAMLLSLVALARGQYVWSAVLAMAAFAIKATGQLATLTAFSYLAIHLTFGRRLMSASERRAAWRGLAINGVLAVIQFALIAWGDTSAALLAGYAWPRALRPPYAIVTLTPDVGVLLLVAAMGTVVVVHRGWIRARGAAILERTWQVIEAERLLVVCWIAVAGLLASSALFVYTPRYVFCVLPAIVLLLGRVLAESFPLRGAVFAVACLLPVANLANSGGRLFPPVDLFDKESFERIPSLTPRLCWFTERSDEYLREHRSTMRAIQFLAQHDGAPIFMAVPYRFLLSNPVLGFVQSPVPPYDATSFEHTIQTFLDVYAPLEGAPMDENPIFVFFGDSLITLPPPEKGDTVLLDDGLEPPLLIYRKALPEGLRGSRQDLEAWYLEKTWGHTWVLARVENRLPYLVKTGQFDRWEDELAQARQLFPQSEHLDHLERFVESVRRGKHHVGGPSAPSSVAGSR